MVAEYDFIVVGSGAGGGPLACRLAEAPEGYRVALLEAGIDPAQTPGSPSYYNYSVPALYANASEDPATSWEFFVQHYENKERQTEDYDSKYYDASHDDSNRGIFYPRAAAVGGCTAHHAMITIYPPDDDWCAIQHLTGCDSWSPDNMRKIFREKIENCQYLAHLTASRAPSSQRKPGAQGADDLGHGTGGWLPVSVVDPTLALGDDKLLTIILNALRAFYLKVSLPVSAASTVGLEGSSPPRASLSSVAELIRGIGPVAFLGELLEVVQRASKLNPNSAETQIGLFVQYLQARLNAGDKSAEDIWGLLRSFSALLGDPNRRFANDSDRIGAFKAPTSILHGVRNGLRERILAVRARYPDRLHLITGALVTGLILEDQPLRAVGVKYLRKEGLYEATPQRKAAVSAPQSQILRVRKGVGEVILAGGAFNTPQLLMLSGIGPKDDIERFKDRNGRPLIRCRVNLPGVGNNLQDRYEVTLVTEFEDEFAILKDLRFQTPVGTAASMDKGLQEWQNHRGLYASNGAVVSFIMRSTKAEGAIPDLYLFGLPGNFKGYYKGWSGDIQRQGQGSQSKEHRWFSWAILKGKTRNRAGYVKLNNADPLARPIINFKYFDGEFKPGAKEWQDDLDAVVEGLQMAAEFMNHPKLLSKIVSQRPDVRNLHGNDLRDKLRDFVKRECWGHHACGTCRIGKDNDKDAVLDGDFRVRGVENLRVVDASVFPKIPGFFIVTSIYVISEKAACVIRRDVIDKQHGKLKPWPQPAPG